MSAAPAFAMQPTDRRRFCGWLALLVLLQVVLLPVHLATAPHTAAVGGVRDGALHWSLVASEPVDAESAPANPAHPVSDHEFAKFVRADDARGDGDGLACDDVATSTWSDALPTPHASRAPPTALHRPAIATSPARRTSAPRAPPTA